MNNAESSLLHDISLKIDKLDDSIKGTNDKVAETNIKVAAATTEIKNLIGWSQQLESRFERLEAGAGCVHGRVLEERVTNNAKTFKDDLKEVKDDLKEVKDNLKTKATKKDATNLSLSSGAAAGTVLSGLIQALLAVFK